MENVFAPYFITMPSSYQESIKNYVSTGTNSQSRENAPFNRQIDFWYMALCLAFNKDLTPIKEKDTYNATTAEILSRNSFRPTQMQMIALSASNDEQILNAPKEMLDICINLANAGIPLLLSILNDPDATPLHNIFDELESLCS